MKLTADEKMALSTEEGQLPEDDRRSGADLAEMMRRFDEAYFPDAPPAPDDIGSRH